MGGLLVLFMAVLQCNLQMTNPNLHFRPFVKFLSAICAGRYRWTLSGSSTISSICLRKHTNGKTNSTALRLSLFDLVCGFFSFLCFSFVFINVFNFQIKNNKKKPTKATSAEASLIYLPQIFEMLSYEILLQSPKAVMKKKDLNENKE